MRACLSGRHILFWTGSFSRLPAVGVGPAKASIPFCVLLLLALLLAACTMPGDAAPVVKIGLIAPFEGTGRPLGYAVLPAVRQAIAEANASGALGRYRVALVALNDDLDPATAAGQAQALLQDAAVLAALGPFDAAAAAAAAPVLAAAGLPALVAAPLDVTPATAGVISLCPLPADLAAALQRAASDAARADPFIFFPGDAGQAAGVLLARRADGWQGVMLAGPDVVRPWFIQLAGAAAEGTRGAACRFPGAPAPAGALPEASLAEAATRALLDALAADIRGQGRPSRSGVAAELARQSAAAGQPQVAWYQVIDGKWAPQP